MDHVTQDKVIIFGYGSLINIASLRATIPDPENINPAYIKGFHRDFSKWDDIGFNKTLKENKQLEIGGIPYCALDVIPVESGKRINGLIFEVGNNYLQALQKRETGYEMLKTAAYCFDTDSLLGTCYLFSSGACDGQYDYNDNSAQAYYLDICLQGAKAYGDSFYNNFLETTYIDNQTLSALSDNQKHPFISLR